MKSGLTTNYTAPKELLNEVPRELENDSDADPMSTTSRTVQSRENDYQSRRYKRPLSPDRGGENESRGYADIMREQQQLMKETNDSQLATQDPKSGADGSRRRRRWDVGVAEPVTVDAKKMSEWDDMDVAKVPARATRISRWDKISVQEEFADVKQRKHRWDETPQVSLGSETPVTGASDAWAATPVIIRENDSDTAEWKVADDMGKEKVPVSDEPDGREGFHLQQIADTVHASSTNEYLPQLDDKVPFMKPEDLQFFAKLLEDVDEHKISLEEAKERKVMRLLLRIKNGTGQVRKNALKDISERAMYFGAAPLFNNILPLMMSPTLEDQERHLLVKVIDRIMLKLDDLVRPFAHKILVVIEPMLIDEDFFARVEGREVISNLAKAVGLATMISVMRPDIDHVDEYVRNTTARAFSVVASALGIKTLLPFLKAVCRSKKSWQARHTGIKIVQQIALLIGCGILPFLGELLEAITPGLSDEQLKVRMITALAISSLAEAASPYGIESFDGVLRPLWNGIQNNRGKSLAAFIKAIGSIIPLMDAEYAGWYTSRIMNVLVREFGSPDEEMKKIVLKVVRQCSATEGITCDYIKDQILPEFLKNFWIRRMSLDRKNYREVVETTRCLAKKTGGAFMIERIMKNMKDESETFRKMTVHSVQKIIADLGSSDIGDRLLELLMDGIQSAFQDQTVEDNDFLDGIGLILTSLDTKCLPFLPSICSGILWRLQNKSVHIRQQAAELIARIAPVLVNCGEDKLLGQFGAVLYEYLGEEYPDVLGSIIFAMKRIVDVIGMTNMKPPIKDLLPRMTPILKNRHERVQEHTIDLIGRVADRGAEYVSSREWMRICFELLETLRAPRKSIRRAAVNTFGYIAKAIGPQDVLVTLLNNLKVQERQNRVCTTVAIAIVSEACEPFTVLPALMNEYRVPELNVQNGVLKALSFMFEYIGDTAKDYVYAVTPLLEDALMDRDQVHRQTACTTVKHLALGCYGANREDALIHLLNYVWPNIFETTMHTASAFLEAIEALRLTLGSGIIFMYLLQGLFHPARKVRENYWRVYETVYNVNPDSFVPFYPCFRESDSQNYHHELDYMI